MIVNFCVVSSHLVMLAGVVTLVEVFLLDLLSAAWKVVYPLSESPGEIMVVTGLYRDPNLFASALFVSCFAVSMIMRNLIQIRCVRFEILVYI